MEFYRQGDVGLVRVDTKFDKRKAEKISPDNGAVVLAWGEKTGHRHQIASDYAKLYRWEGERLLEVGKQGAELRHEEHDTITLPAGTYRVIQQKEYFPDAIRNVQD